jgi:hypothetical protein
MWRRLWCGGYGGCDYDGSDVWWWWFEKLVS